MRTVIKNAKIINPAGMVIGDILIEDEVIIAFGRGFNADRVIDAQGQMVTPGGVDAHVHLQYHVGGYDTADDFASGMAAAAMGGTTTVIDFVEALPEEPLLSALMRRNDQARRVAPIDYSLHMSILPTDMNKLDQIPDVIRAGCPSFKHYMAYGFTLNDGQLYQSMKVIGRNGGIAMVHAENWDVIQELTKDLINAGRTSALYHMYSRPTYLENQAVHRALDTARLANCPIYLCHLTCDADVITLLQYRREGQKAWGETCTHYCYLNDQAFQKLGNRAICSPPLRTEEERKAMSRHLRQGHLHTVSTDHCPFTSEEKMEHESFNKVPGGLSGIEGRLMLMHALPNIELKRWVEVCCATPARLMGLQRKGLVSPGFDADLVIWKEDPHTITASELHEKADWSPFEGYKVKIRPSIVLCRGKVIVQDGQYLGTPGYGRYVERHIVDEPVIEATTRYESPESSAKRGGKLFGCTCPDPSIANQNISPANSKGSSDAINNTSRGLHHIMIGLGWDAAQSNFVTKMLFRLGGDEPKNINLDLSLLLLNNEGRPVAIETDQCCLTCRNSKLLDCMIHTGDNTTGEGTGYKEIITVNLDAIPPHVSKLAVLANINNGAKYGQDFTMAGDAFVALANIDLSKEVARQSIASLREMNGVVAMELARNEAGTGWEYSLLGRGLANVNSVEDILALYR